MEDAVRLGADAVGYTLYVGSPSQDVDIAQFNEVRRDCEKYAMPLIVWAYPRGAAVKAKGGVDSLYAIDYAARVACEVGADIIKLNEPKWDGSTAGKMPMPYNTLDSRRRRAAQSRPLGRPFARTRLGWKQNER